MSHKIKLLSCLFALVVVVGLPPILVLTTGLSPVQPPAGVRSQDPLRALLASRSTLELAYQGWQERYLRAGGDRNAAIGLGWARGLSSEYTPALGRLAIDLLGGSLAAEVQGLGTRAADLWLVDNQPGPGRSVQPEPGDRMVRVGRLRGDGERVRLVASLGKDFFAGFELDLVVVTPAGQDPAEGRLLIGTRSYFERLHTRTRLAQERRALRERGLASLLPAALAALLGPRTADANSSSILVAHGLVSQAVANGADLFFRGTFSGNGRTCGSCHPVVNNQVMDTEFMATMSPTDKLFVAELPASQGGVPGLERPALMHQFGLILENLDGAENPTVKFTMRGVPHSLSLLTSIAPPNDGRAAAQRTGWSADGAPAPGTLRLFSVGAVFQHFTKRLERVAGVDFRFPTDLELDAMEAFMLAAGRLNDLNLLQVSLTNPGAESGRLIFNNGALGKCGGCHGNAGANATFADGKNRNFNTGVERVPHPARAVESFPFDGGFGATNPFDSNGDGVADSFGDGTFNTPGLVEAADTAPFFHNNVIAGLEAAVAFYSGPEFNASPAGAAVGGISLTAQQNNDVAAFLRVINAAFNIAISIQRNDAAGSLENSSCGGGGGGGVEVIAPLGGGDICPEGAGGVDDVNGKRETVNTLLALANAEALDAIEVLHARSLHPATVDLLQRAINSNQLAIGTQGSNERKSLILSAANDFRTAKSQLGTGLDFTLGEGNLIF